MMTTRRLFILPYKMGSASAKALAQRLGIKRLKRDGGKYRPRESDLIVNWGSSSTTISPASTVMNSTDSVCIAGCKLLALSALSQAGLSVPDWTQNPSQAMDWLQSGSKVLARHQLRGHSGSGIVICTTEDELLANQTAPLFVKYVPKKQEYRVHVFNGAVIDVQRKMRNRDVPDDQVNWMVRNHSNGFIFGREGVSLSSTATQLCIDAVAALGLDFGAVDLMWNEHSDTYYVLEINTAPGLTGTTLEKYAEAIEDLL